MTMEEGRELLCKYGRVLADRGLVARTWGNLSLRIGEAMLITPSGIPYEDLTEADMVEVSIGGLSWSGPRKPSSEKALHATVYRACPAVGAIFHTHQTLASAIAAAREAIPVSPGSRRGVLGDRVPCADYALPTTDALARAVGRLLPPGEGAGFFPAVLLANHGALCMGAAAEQALDAARELESLAREVLVSAARAREPGSEAAFLPPSVAPLAVAAESAGAADPFLASCRRLIELGLLVRPEDILIRKDAGLETLGADGGAVPAGGEASELAGLLHRSALDGGTGNRCFLLSRGPATLAAARAGTGLEPLLDDMAQMFGVRIARAAPRRNGFRPARNSAILVDGLGALCAAADPYELAALAQVTEKAAVAQAGGLALGKWHPISFAESLLMRAMYLLKYSKRAKAHG